MKTYKSKYASIEQDEYGKWHVYNDVTGLPILTDVSYQQAITKMRELSQHYDALEYGEN